MRVLGIDEAGRGCVLGDLVVAGFLIEDLDPDMLRAAGADDSKRLSLAQRLTVRDALGPFGTADVRRIAPAAIDAANLNRLEEEVIVDLVRRWRPDAVIVDALGHPSALPGIVARLRARCGEAGDARWTMEPGADHTYPVVGAASIFAKTTRDALLDEVDATHGPLGTGYPSDPVTRAWLRRWSDSGRPWPSFVRTRWQTITNLAQQQLF